MNETIDTEIRAFRASESVPLPAGAVELFGNEVEDAWNAATPQREPVCIGLTSAEGQLLAGAFVLLENDASGGKVASVRQLIIPPLFRGRGLAGRVLRRAMSLGRDAGCARIRSTAGWGCPDHLMIYERMKFDRAGSTDRPYLVSKSLA
jgi:hypothetical protein